MIILFLCVFTIIIITILIIPSNTKVKGKDHFVTREKWLSDKWLLEIPQPQKKVCIFCYETRHQAGLQKLKALNATYCRVNNYTFLYHERSSVDKIYPPYWIKVKLAYDLLQTQEYDYIGWIDSDVVMHDTNIRVESIFSVLGPDYFFVKSTDNDHWLNRFNAGVWFVKSCPQALDFFHDWLSSYPATSWKRLKQNKWICTTCTTYANGPEYEQGAGTTLLESEKYKSAVLTLDWRILQGYDLANVKDIAFTLHFSGDLKNFMYKYIHQIPVTDTIQYSDR